MNSEPTFNYVQNVFTLNMFSNFASAKKAPVPQLQTDLTQILAALLNNTDVQKLIGTWKVVWGPVVGSYGIDIKREAASNAMYVAVNQDGQYVVAVSATNPTSLYGWFVEDFDVKNMVLWSGVLAGNLKDPGAARISQGSSDGLNHLLGMVDPGGVTLMTFLQNTFSSTTDTVQLAVSGHSLGGALSAVLALYINQTISIWNPAGTVIVSAEPTAGASPGNKAFSDYHNKTMGARTLRFWNSLDPVPHGWEPDMIEQVPLLYYPYFKPGALLKGLIVLVVAQSLEGTAPYPEGGLYTQLQPQTPPLQGQVAITQTRNLYAAEVLEFFLDFEASSILKKLGVNSIVSALIVDALYLILKEFAGQDTLDVLMAEIRAKLQKIIGHEPFFEKFLLLLETLLNEVENIMVFLIQLVFQHVTTYTDLMGTSAMHPLSQSIINNMVTGGKLDADYLNVLDKLTDPKRALKLAAPKVGEKLLTLLTDDFIKKAGLKLL